MTDKHHPATEGIYEDLGESIREWAKGKGYDTELVDPSLSHTMKLLLNQYVLDIIELNGRKKNGQMCNELLPTEGLES